MYFNMLINDLICSKAQELYQLIEGQNTTLCKLREMVHRSQHAQSKVRPDAHLVVRSRIISCLQAVESACFVIVPPGSRGGLRILDGRPAAGRAGGSAELPVLPGARAGGQSKEFKTEPEARRGSG